MSTSPSGPRLRSVLDDIPAYVPGRPASARAAHKLSSNENPYPPLPSVMAAVMAAAAELNRYPDLASIDLVAALAVRFGVEPACIALGTGSVGVLQQLVQVTSGPGDEIVHAWRSFEAYPIVSRISGADSVPVPLGPDGRHDLVAMADAVTTRTRLVMVCTPNNPTGPAVRHDELVQFLDAVPEDVLVVLDEAYVEFVRDPAAADGLSLLRARPNVAVLRTFSKAYGLAGLRIGFALAHASVAAALRKTAVPFGVSAIAQVAAVASLAAEGELRRRVADLVAERDRVEVALRAQGWDVPDSEANFFWLPTGAATLEAAAHFEHGGAIVRPFAGEGCRVTIAEAAANDLFLELAETAPSEPGSHPRRRAAPR